MICPVLHAVKLAIRLIIAQLKVTLYRRAGTHVTRQEAEGRQAAGRNKKETVY